MTVERSTKQQNCLATELELSIKDNKEVGRVDICLSLKFSDSSTSRPVSWGITGVKDPTKLLTLRRRARNSKCCWPSQVTLNPVPLPDLCAPHPHWLPSDPDDLNGAPFWPSVEADFMQDSRHVPVRMANGELQVRIKDVGSDGFGIPWGHTRIYSNRLSNSFNFGNGANWLVHEWPRLVLFKSATTSLALDQDGEKSQKTGCSFAFLRGTRNTVWFDQHKTSAGTLKWLARYGAKHRAAATESPLSHVKGSPKAFVIKIGAPNGHFWEFFDFTCPTSKEYDKLKLTKEQRNAIAPGHLKRHYGPGGSEEQLVETKYNKCKLQETVRETRDGHKERLVYEYITDKDDPNEGLLKAVSLHRDASSTPGPVSRAVYSYYGDKDQHGNRGDLRTVENQFWKDGDWKSRPNALELYAYYKQPMGSYAQGMLKAVLSPEGYHLMVTAGRNPLQDGPLKEYADLWIEYNARRQVEKVWVDGGSRTHGFQYKEFNGEPRYNRRTFLTVETRNDGASEAVDSNFLGEGILRRLQEQESSRTNGSWIEWNKYDDKTGSLRRSYPPAAIATASVNARTQEPSVSVLLSNGPVLGLDYYSDNTLKTVSIGKASSFTGEVGQGLPNDWTRVASYTYKTFRVNALATSGLLADCYADIFALESQTTTIEQKPNVYLNSRIGFANIWYKTTGPVERDSAALKERTTFLPAVPIEQHGLGEPGLIVDSFDRYGFLRERKDERGARYELEYYPDRSVVGQSTLNGVKTEYAQYDGFGRPTTLDGGRFAAITDTATNASENIRSATIFKYFDLDGIVMQGQGYTRNGQVTGEQATLMSPFRVTQHDRVGRIIKSGEVVGTPPEEVSSTFLQNAAWSRSEESLYDASNWLGEHRVYDRIADGRYAPTFFFPDSMGRVETVEHPDGTVVKTPFDVRGLPTAKLSGLSSEALHLVASFEFDNAEGGKNGNLTRQTFYVGGEESERIAVMTYDWRNRAVTLNVGEAVEEYVFANDLGGKVHTTKFATQSVESTIINYRDVRGRVYARSHSRKRYLAKPTFEAVMWDLYWRDQSGGIIKSQSAGQTAYTRTFFDRRGRPYLTSIGYHEENLGVDPTSPTVLVQDRVLEMHEVHYDNVDNVLRQVTHRVNNSALVSPGDIRGNASTRVDQVDFWYDPLGRNVGHASYGHASTAEPSATIPESTDWILVSRSFYNLRGEPETLVSPKGVVIVSQFDDAGREVSAATAGLRTEATEYYADGRVRLTKVAGTQAGEEVTEYRYGTAINSIDGSLVTEVLTGGIAQSCVYNFQGQPTSAIDANGTTHEYRYDGFGRMTDDVVTAVGDGVDDAVRRLQYVFDEHGRVSDMVSYANPDISADNSSELVPNQFQGALNRVHRGYTAFGQVETEMFFEQGRHLGGIAYTYSNAPGPILLPADPPSGTDLPHGNTVRLSAVRYPSSARVAFDYGPAGGSDDSLSRVSAVHFLVPGSPKLPLALARYNYWGAASVYEVSRYIGDEPLLISQSLQSVVLGNSQPFGALDRHNRQREVQWKKGPAQTSLVASTYDFDRHSLPTRRNTEAFGYTSLDQLRYSVDSAGVKGWVLDSVGNWQYVAQTSPEALIQSRKHTDTNRISDIRTYIGETWQTPQYDKNGNTVSFPAPADPTKAIEARFDAWNRLVKVTESDTTFYFYNYDALGRRIAKISSSPNWQESRRYYYSAAWQLLEEHLASPLTDGKFELLSRYAWGVGRDELILRDRIVNGAVERLNPLTDLTGNVTALLGTFGAEKGNVLTRFAYNAYGAPQVSGTDFDWNILYGGYHYDSETGLYCVRRRFLHPGLGRWLQNDPLGSSNLYEYADSSPIINVDPNGEEPISLAFALGFAFGMVLIGSLAAKQESQRMSDAADRMDEEEFLDAQAKFNGSVGVVAAGLAAPFAAPFVGPSAGLGSIMLGGGIEGGIATGFTGGVTTYAKGGNAGEVARAALSGGLWGGATGAISAPFFHLTFWGGARLLGRAGRLFGRLKNSSDLYWHGDQAGVALRRAYGILAAEPGAGRRYWVTSLKKLNRWTTFWIGGSTELMSKRFPYVGYRAKRVFEATYQLSAAEVSQFRRAWGPRFSYDMFEWWKGFAGQYYYQPARVTVGQRLRELGVFGVKAGVTGGLVYSGARLLDRR